MSTVKTVIQCDVSPDELEFVNGDGTPVFYASREGQTRVSIYPSRNGVIRLRKALGEYLKATRKDKR